MRRLLFLLALSTACSAFCQNYVINVFAGTGPGGSGNGPGLGPANGVAVDPAGNLFMVLSGAQVAGPSIAEGHQLPAGVVVRRDAATGVLSVVAGTAAQGYRAADDCNLAVNAELNQPSGLAADSAGNLYIADTGNNRIRMVSKGIIYTVAGNGTAGFGGDGGDAVNAELNGPYGVALDAHGNLYIADSGNNRIRMVSNGVITTVAGGGTQEGDGGPALEAQLNNPYGVVVDDATGNLYIADSQNNRVRVVAGGVISDVAGTGINGLGGDNDQGTRAELWFPKAVALDSAGNLYIADNQNNRVRVVAVVSGTITTFAGTGTAGFDGDLGPATAAQLKNVTGVAVSPTGVVYIADMGNDSVRKVDSDPNRTISTVAGAFLPPAAGLTGAGLPLGDGGPASGALLLFPSPNAANLAEDSSGNLYIADTAQNRIRKVSNGIITSVAGTGTAGFSGDDGPAIEAELNGPTAITVAAGNVYFADSGNSRIRRVDEDGVITTVANGVSAVGLAVDTNGNIYFSEGNVIRIVGQNGNNPVVVGGGSPQPQPPCPNPLPANNIPALCAVLADLGALGFDVLGSLYFVDSWQIWKLSSGSSPTMGIVAGNGTLGFSGDGGFATTAQIHDTFGIAFDSFNNMFITDNARIREVSNGVITTIAGGGATSRGTYLAEPGQPATNYALNNPTGIAVDAKGNIYFGDDPFVFVLSPPTAPAACPLLGCLYSVMPTSVQPPASGATITVSVETDAGCSWTTADLPYWITVSGSASGAGPGGVTLVVLPNGSSSPRSATIYIAGQPINVAQAANTCSYSISPGGQSFTSTGGAGSFAITTGAGCSWSSNSMVAWVVIGSPASGSGNGTISYTVAVNTGAGRTGNISVAGLLFAIAQASASGGTSGAVQQSILIGPQSLSGTCGSSAPQARWNNAGILTIAVQPTLSSLAVSGGSFSGSGSYVAAGLSCSGANESLAGGFPVSGTVAPGGATSLTILIDGSCAATGSGTVNSLSGSVPAACLNGFDGYAGATGTGTFEVFSPSSSQAVSTTLIGSENSAGLCGTTTQAWNNAGIFTISVQPGLSSLVSSGGSFTGQASLVDGGTMGCGTGGQDFEAATVTGTVAPGGATTMTLTFVPVNAPACSANATGTVYELSGTIPAACFTDYDSIAGSSGLGTFVVSDPTSPQSTLTALVGSVSLAGVCTAPQTSPWNFRGIIAASLQPSLNSLVASGGTFSGIGGVVISSADCGSNDNATGGGTGVSGSVQAGGAASVTLDLGSAECPVTTAGTIQGFNVTIPPACLADFHLPGSPESGTIELSNLANSASGASLSPSINQNGVVPLFSSTNTVQPGEWASIYGANLAMGTVSWSGNFPTSLGGTSVTIDGRPAYLSFVSPSQVNVQVPDDTASGPVPVAVTTANGIAVSTVALAPVGPSLLLLDTTHALGIILRFDGSGAFGGGTYDLLGPTGSSLGYPTVAAKPGDIVELYGTGFGPTSPSVPAGQPFSGAAQTTNPVVVMINNASVTPSFTGLSSAGLYQINLTVPAGLGAGDLPLVAHVAGVQTQPGVTIPLHQ